MSKALLARRHGRRAVSNVISTVLLIIIAIALVVALYFMVGKFMHTGTTVSASAQLVQSSYTNNGANQQLVFSIQVTSQTRMPLMLKDVVALVTYSSGTVSPITLTPGSSQLVLGTTNATILNPGTSQTYEVILTGSTSNAISSVAFQLVFITPSGNTVTVTTNSVQVIT